MEMKHTQVEMIDLYSSQVELLSEKFNKNKSFIRKALNLVEIPNLNFEENIQNRDEARIICFNSRTNPERKRFSIRKLIEFAETEKQVMEAFYLSINDIETMMCIRRMADLIFVLA